MAFWNFILFPYFYVFAMLRARCVWHWTRQWWLLLPSSIFLHLYHIYKRPPSVERSKSFVKSKVRWIEMVVNRGHAFNCDCIRSIRKRNTTSGVIVLNSQFLPQNSFAGSPGHMSHINKLNFKFSINKLNINKSNFR